jgi:hypothetical protein
VKGICIAKGFRFGAFGKLKHLLKALFGLNAVSIQISMIQFIACLGIWIDTGCAFGTGLWLLVTANQKEAQKCGRSWDMLHSNIGLF